VAQHRPTLKVDFFGAPIGWLEAPYAYEDHGVLDDESLASLYRRGTLGVVFSSTNYSLTSHEMMACGLPVLELASESSRLAFPPRTITLAEPTPQDIAEQIERLLDQRGLREA